MYKCLRQRSGARCAVADCAMHASAGDDRCASAATGSTTGCPLRGPLRKRPQTRQPRFSRYQDLFAHRDDDCLTYKRWAPTLGFRFPGVVVARRNDGLIKRCGCSRRLWTKCSHPWHLSFCYGRTDDGRKARYRFSLQKFSNKPANYVMSRTEAEGFADRIRTGIRSGEIQLEEPAALGGSGSAASELTLRDVASRYLNEYARTETRRPHAIRQFEIYMELLQSARVQGPGGVPVVLGSRPFKLIVRADLDEVFASRLSAIEASRQAGRKVEQLLAEGKAVPVELRRAAALAGRSMKGGHVALNRFKARARHFFNWAIAQGYRDDTPFKRHGVNVVRLNTAAETVRDRRLRPGEEERLIAAAAPHLRALIIGALSTGCRVGELLTLQWRDVQIDNTGRYRALLLRAGKTKTGTMRIVPVGQRLAAVLEMLRTDPAGNDLPAEAFVFGDEIGANIASVKTAWRSACASADIEDLHFHDLRREFACRLLESRAELHDVRDFLGHSNITTTSRYLRSTTLRLERALSLLEQHGLPEAGANNGSQDSNGSRKSATLVPHGAFDSDKADDHIDAEIVDVIEDVVVSPEGIEPSTNRLRVCCSAS
jgi:integrase